MFEFLFNHWPIVFVASAIFIAWGFAKLMLDETKLPYQKRASLLTSSQLSFYKALREAVDGAWAIESTVPISDLIEVVPEAPRRQAWQGRIPGKQFDFLLCAHDTMEPQLAIELQEPAEEPSEPSPADRFVDRVLADAGLSLLRIDIQASYDSGQVRKAIAESLKSDNA